MIACDLFKLYANYLIFYIFNKKQKWKSGDLVKGARLHFE